MKPLIMAHRGGDCFGIENSAEAIIKSVENKVDIVELDIRKSKDGKLFCYHGNLFQFIFPGYFNRNFKELENKFPSLISLHKASKLVKGNSALFLDIKDRRIKIDEIIGCLPELKDKKVYLAANSFNYHKSLGEIPKNWVKVYNVGIPLFTKSTINKILENNITIVELFFWSFNKKNIKKLKDNNVHFALSSGFLFEKKYTHLCLNNKTFWVQNFDIPNLIHTKKKYYQIEQE